MKVQAYNDFKRDYRDFINLLNRVDRYKEDHFIDNRPGADEPDFIRRKIEKKREQFEKKWGVDPDTGLADRLSKTSISNFYRIARDYGLFE